MIGRVLAMGLSVGLMLGLTGCATMDGGAWWRDLTGQGVPVGEYHFDWRLSGDTSVAPLQVFDDGRQTWLQYPPTQTAPALFARTSTGDRLLQARREGDYLVVRGVPDRLVIRGGLLQAEAWRPQAGVASAASSAAEPLTVAAPPLVATGPQPLALPAPAGMPVSRSPAMPEFADPQAPAKTGQATATLRADRKKPRASANREAVDPAVTRPLDAFEVTPADGNLRRALARWARLAGWTFEAEHWAVDVDIPLAGSAVFKEPFRAAVRGLLAATELGDRPVQPCFYANQVLRVIPLAQRCDRTQQPGAES
ncbi:TcpQ domain-containing protein [Castellaniella sp. MT123]|uniref:TcpQ domain-containing protein n=1 Tax=Castellaniella sp. MT123 TaxID=3140381 RepID=UPI0031F4652D